MQEITFAQVWNSLPEELTLALNIILSHAKWLKREEKTRNLKKNREKFCRLQKKY